MLIGQIMQIIDRLPAVWAENEQDIFGSELFFFLDRFVFHRILYILWINILFINTSVMNVTSDSNTNGNRADMDIINGYNSSNNMTKNAIKAAASPSIRQAANIDNSLEKPMVNKSQSIFDSSIFLG